jgi:predicted TPR repeat methyltransferase
VRHLDCFDISSEMIKKATAVVAGQGLSERVAFHLLEKCALPSQDAAFDFIYAFDVFPHCGMLFRFENFCV